MPCVRPLGAAKPRPASARKQRGLLADSPSACVGRAAALLHDQGERPGDRRGAAPTPSGAPASGAARCRPLSDRGGPGELRPRRRAVLPELSLPLPRFRRIRDRAPGRRGSARRRGRRDPGGDLHTRPLTPRRDSLRRHAHRGRHLRDADLQRAPTGLPLGDARRLRRHHREFVGRRAPRGRDRCGAARDALRSTDRARYDGRVPF